jgi:hypothetical protein
MVNGCSCNLPNRNNRWGSDSRHGQRRREMKVILTAGEARVEVEGDDDLIAENLSYQCTFEQVVRKVTDDFYRVEKLDAQGRKG